MSNSVALSTVIYLSMFTLSVAFAAISEKMFKSRNLICSAKHLKTLKNEQYFYLYTGIIAAACAIALPCILASVRATSVGNDISVYVLPNYNIAEKMSVSIQSFIEFQGVSNCELLFSLLIFLGAKIGSVSLIFFLTELLIIIPVYYSLWLERDQLSLPAGLVIYYLLWYSFSLSGMRQSIAMSFILMAFVLWCQGKEKKKILLSVVIAALFHVSALLVVAIVFILCIINKVSYKKFKYMNLVVLLGLFIFYRVFENLLAGFLELVQPRYAQYIYENAETAMDFNSIPMTDLLAKTAPLIYATFIIKKQMPSSTHSKHEKFELSLSWLGRYFLLFMVNFKESLRIAFYFDYIYILTLPRSFKIVKCNKNRKVTYMSIIILFGPLLAYWFYNYMVLGVYKTNIFLLSF